MEAPSRWVRDPDVRSIWAEPSPAEKRRTQMQRAQPFWDGFFMEHPDLRGCEDVGMTLLLKKLSLASLPNTAENRAIVAHAIREVLGSKEVPRG